MTDRYLSRGKRADNGEWVEGAPLFKNGKCFIITDIFNCDEYQCIGAENYEVIPETVGQCTGLKDKNGKLIFEGDVCDNDGSVGVIRYDKCDAMYTFIYDENITTNFNYIWGEDLEIIGNTTDTPELLEVKE